MSNVDGRFATGTVFPINPSSHSLSSPLTPSKSSLVRKFAQFCWHLPSHRHFMAWCPRELLSCCMAGSMWHSARGCSLGAQGNEGTLLLPGTHSSRESSPLLNAEGSLPAHVFLHSTFHINLICTWVPALQLVWKVRDSLAYHLLWLPSLYSSEQKTAQIDNVLPQKGERDTL